MRKVYIVESIWLDPFMGAITTVLYRSFDKNQAKERLKRERERTSESLPILYRLGEIDIDDVE